MNYRYIAPMFTANDYDLAKDFLSVNMYKAITKNMPKKDIPNEDTVKKIAEKMVETMYGKNIIMMANFYVVQDTIVNKYIDRITKYLSNVGIQSDYVELKYPEIIPEVILMKSQDEDFKPLTPFNPNEEWDLEYGNDIEKNLMNPLNTLSHYYIEMKSIREYDFLESISTSIYRNSISERIKYWRKENTPVDLCIKVLPSDNLYSINILTKNIYKYF